MKYLLYLMLPNSTATVNLIRFLVNNKEPKMAPRLKEMDEHDPDQRRRLYLHIGAGMQHPGGLYPPSSLHA